MKKTTETDTALAAGCESSLAAAKSACAKPRGRPLSFDRDVALDKAMHVFWERGYEAASISDLTAAMGITPPSLYTAFGDKERLFFEAIERYATGPGGIGRRALDEEPTAHGAIKRWLEDAADELTQPCHPAGCMVVMATTNCSVAAERVQASLAKRRAEGEARVRARIQQGIDEGELPPSTDALALANFYVTVYQGMSMQAKDGASRETLLASAAMAMRSWPADPPRRPAAGKPTKVSAAPPKRRAATAVR